MDLNIDDLEKEDDIKTSYFEMLANLLNEYEEGKGAIKEQDKNKLRYRSCFEKLTMQMDGGQIIYKNRIVTCCLPKKTTPLSRINNPESQLAVSQTCSKPDCCLS